MGRIMGLVRAVVRPVLVRLVGVLEWFYRDVPTLSREQVVAAHGEEAWQPEEVYYALDRDHVVGDHLYYRLKAVLTGDRNSVSGMRKRRRLLDQRRKTMKG